MIYERMKEIREYFGDTQKEIAETLNTTRSTYAGWENGLDAIPLLKLNEFCNHYGISLDYVCGLTNIKKYNNSKKDIDIHIVATRLKETRKENKYTQEYVAKLLNTNHSVWCRYEQGKYLINTSFLYSYCIKTKLSSDFLLGKIDNPKYLK